MAERYSVEVFLNVNIGEFKNYIQDAEKSVKELEKTADDASLTLGKLAESIGLTALATKGLDMVKDSIQDAFGRIDAMEQFEKDMTTITGASEKAAEVLKKTGDIVKGTSYSFDVGAQAVQSFVTSNMDVDKATETVAAWGDAVAFYGDGSNESFASVSDALAKMAEEGKIQMDTMNRLTEAGIPALQIFADATGRSVEEVAEQMQKGELSAEEFNSVMNDSLVNGTKNFAGIAGAAKEAGGSWEESFENMQAAVTSGVVNIISKIDEMLISNGLPDMRAMIASFGSKFEEVLNKVSDLIPVFVENIKSVYDTLKPWLPLLGAVATAVFGMIVAWSTFNSIKQTIANVGESFKHLNGIMAANPWILLIGAIIAAAVLIYVYWEPIKEFFINLWLSIKEAGLAIWDVLQDAWSTTVEWFKGLWLPIAEFFTNLWSSITEVATSGWDSVVEKWNSIVSFLVEIFSPMIEFYSNLWTTITTTAIEIFQIFSETLATTWSSIQTIAAVAWEIIKNVILGPILLLINLVTGDFNEFASNLSQIQDNIKAAASRIWEELKTGVVAILIDLVKIGLKLWNNFKETLANLILAIKQTATNLWEQLKASVISTLVGLVSSAIGKWDELKSRAIEIVGNIVRDLLQKWDNLKTDTLQKIIDVKDTVVNTIKGIDLNQIGKDIIQGLINGIISKVTAVTDAVKEVTSAITGKIKGILGIKSPSRVFMGFGDNISEGLAIGIDKAAGLAEKASTALGLGVGNAFNSQLVADGFDIAGQVNSINRQVNRRLQSDFSNEINVNKQPAVIKVYVGSRQIAEEIVDDISQLQGDQYAVRRSTLGY